MMIIIITFTYININFVLLIAAKSSSFQSTENLYPHYSGIKISCFFLLFFIIILLS